MAVSRQQATTVSSCISFQRLFALWPFECMHRQLSQTKVPDIHSNGRNADSPVKPVLTGWETGKPFDERRLLLRNWSRRQASGDWSASVVRENCCSRNNETGIPHKEHERTTPLHSRSSNVAQLSLSSSALYVLPFDFVGYECEQPFLCSSIRRLSILFTTCSVGLTTATENALVKDTFRSIRTSKINYSTDSVSRLTFQSSMITEVAERRSGGHSLKVQKDILYRQAALSSNQRILNFNQN